MTAVQNQEKTMQVVSSPADADDSAKNPDPEDDLDWGDPEWGVNACLEWDCEGVGDKDAPIALKLEQPDSDSDIEVVDHPSQSSIIVDPNADMNAPPTPPSAQPPSPSKQTKKKKPAAKDIAIAVAKRITTKPTVKLSTKVNPPISPKTKTKPEYDKVSNDEMTSIFRNMITRDENLHLKILRYEVSGSVYLPNLVIYNLDFFKTCSIISQSILRYSTTWPSLKISIHVVYVSSCAISSMLRCVCLANA